MAQYQQQYPQEYHQPQPQMHATQQQPQMHTPEQPTMAHTTYTSPQGMTPNEKPPMQEQTHVHNHNDSNNPQSEEKGSKRWAFGLFDCFSPLDTCCISFWCPCYLFGKTYQRNKTGEASPSGLNGMCCAYVATLYCGCAPILQCMQRQNTRERHGIKGSILEDFAVGCCCACCALVQEEKESVVRVRGVDPKTGMVYRPVEGMIYP